MDWVREQTALKGRESLILTGENTSRKSFSCHDVYGLPAADRDTMC